MLRLEQSQEYNRFSKLSGFFGNNATIITSFTPFSNEVANFNFNFQSLDALIPNKSAVTSGITSEKTVLKQKIADGISLVCKKTRAYALLNNQLELAAETNIRNDIIVRMKDADILPYAQNIQNVITPVLADPAFAAYNVTAAMLSGIVTDATNFNGMIGKADNMASGNTTANTAINDAIKKLHVNITHFDLLVDEFEAANPAFVQGYHINSSLDTTGMHHSGLEGKITAKATGLPVNLATITLTANGKLPKTAITDITGAYHADRVSPGDYMITVNATGFAEQTAMHHITRGKIDEMNWEL